MRIRGGVEGSCSTSAAHEGEALVRFLLLFLVRLQVTLEHGSGPVQIPQLGVATAFPCPQGVRGGSKKNPPPRKKNGSNTIKRTLH